MRLPRSLPQIELLRLQVVLRRRRIDLRQHKIDNRSSQIGLLLPQIDLCCLQVELRRRRKGGEAGCSKGAKRHHSIRGGELLFSPPPATRSSAIAGESAVREVEGFCAAARDRGMGAETLVLSADLEEGSDAPAAIPSPFWSGSSPLPPVQKIRFVLVATW